MNAGASGRKEGTALAAYIPVPRDLSRVKSKVFFNLTKRQLICFGGAALIGVPAFFLMKKVTGNISLSVIRIAPLSLYAVLKEVHGIRRFQLLAYPGNKLELRMEEKNGEDRTKVFETAKMRLEEYLSSQGIRHVAISMSEDLPQQDPNSGKFKHVVNMQRNL